MSGFADRFARLEIPDEKRRADWTFLEAPLELPGPLPLEEPLLAIVNGRCFVPGDGAPAGGQGMVLYDRTHALTETDGPGARERAWQSRHDKALKKLGKRFRDSIPASVLTEPRLMQEARSLLEAGVPDARPADERQAVPGSLGPVPLDGSAAAGLVGWSRLLVIHKKLYDLRTLHEYASIFAKAIDPALQALIGALPATVAPEELLALLEKNLDKLHAKARSPLRNKLLSSRVVLNGVTLLPMYREPSAALQGAHAALLARRLKLELLADRG